MLDTLGPNTLEDRCNKLRAVMVYKIIHNLVDIENCGSTVTFTNIFSARH